ncbi:MAG: DUF2079 domain-containing protein [Anaerolineae bacterium]
MWLSEDDSELSPQGNRIALLIGEITMEPSSVNTLFEFAGTMIAGLVGAMVVYRWRFSIQDWVQSRGHDSFARRASVSLLAVLLTLYVVLFAALSLRKHSNFRTHNDLAIHSQVVWNTSQGRLFETTLLEDRPTNYLGHHFSPALLLLAPLYSLWPDARLLLIVQSVALALGAVPIFMLVQNQTRSQLLGLTLSLAYLLFPALHYVNLFDFHDVILGVPLLSFASFCLLTRRYRLLFVFLALSLLVKEEMAFIAFAFGLYILIVQRRRRLGLLVMLLAVAWGIVTMRIIMPSIAGRAYFPVGRYGYLGSSFGEIAVSVVRNPVLVLQHLLTPAKIEFLLHLLAPLAFLPLLGFDTLLLAIPTMLYLLLSDYEPQYSMQYHYAAPLIPLLVMSAATGAARLMRRRERSVSVALSALVLVTSVTSYLLHSPGPVARHFNEDGAYTLWPDLASGYDALAAIPPEAPVMTLEEFAPHLASRESIYVENENYLPVEYIFQEYTARTASPRYPALVPPGRELLYPYCETIFDNDGYWVRRYLESVPVSHSVGATFDSKLTLLAYEWRDSKGLPAPVLKPGEVLDLIIAWRAEQELPERYVFFVHLLDQDAHRWAQVDQEVEKGVYPTNLWERGMVVADHYSLSVPWGTPPGKYQVLIGAYSEETGRRLPPEETRLEVRDNALPLATIEVTRPTYPPPLEEVAAQHRLGIAFTDEIELVGFDLGQDSAEPGQQVPLILIWRALSEPTEDYLVSLRLKPIDGEHEQSWLQLPAGGTYPTSKWEQGAVVRDWHDLGLAPDTAPGVYELSVSLVKPDGGAVRSEVGLGTVTVEGRRRVFTMPQIQSPLDARLGGSVAFLGYDQSSTTVRPGETIRLTLYWQALREMGTSYTVFTHLLDAEERIWGQMDSIPQRGEAPTTSWLVGEVITDQYEIVVAPDAHRGTYLLEIGMYDASTGQRLSVLSHDQVVEEDRLLLGVVHVVP